MSEKTNKKRKKKTRPFTKRDASRVLAVNELKLFLNSPQNLREKIVAGLFVFSGLRRVDITNLTISAINFETKTVRTLQRKTKTWHEMDLPDALLTDLRIYINTELKKLKTRHMFPRLKGDHSKPIGVRRMSYVIRAMCKRADLKRVRPHDFRKTFYTRSGEKDIDPDLISTTTGTTGGTVRDWYKEFTPDERRRQISRLWEDLI